MQREFAEYIESTNLEALISQLTELCFMSKTNEPKRFIANFCSSGTPEEAQGRKYKDKYKAAKKRVAKLTQEVGQLKEEVAVLKHTLEDLRKVVRYVST